MNVSFLFLRCQVRAEGDLVVAVPADSMWRAGKSGKGGLAWGTPAQVPAQVLLESAAGPHQRFDHVEYAREKPYPHAAEFRFRGAVWFGRVPTSEGWALCVQAAVRSLPGLAEADAVMVASPAPAGGSAPGDGGPVNGPHLPWP